MAEETSITSRVLTSIAPRNHLPLTERPLDHTIAFRRDHASAAERDATRAATRAELGAETPWHVSRFFPTYRLTDLDPTPVATIQRAVAIGRAALWCRPSARSTRPSSFCALTTTRASCVMSWRGEKVRAIRRFRV